MYQISLINDWFKIPRWWRDMVKEINSCGNWAGIEEYLNTFNATKTVSESKYNIIVSFNTEEDYIIFKLRHVY